MIGSIKSALNKLIDDFKNYLETQFEYIKFDLTEKLTRIATSIITVSIIILLLLPFVFFISFALAYYLGNYFGSDPIGFLIVAGIYLIIAIFTIALRKPLIINPLLRKFVNVIFSDYNRQIKEEEEDEE